METVILVVASFVLGCLWRDYVNYRRQTQTTKLLHSIQFWVESYIMNTPEKQQYDGAEKLAEQLKEILSPREVIWHNAKKHSIENS